MVYSFGLNFHIQCIVLALIFIYNVLPYVVYDQRRLMQVIAIRRVSDRYIHRGGSRISAKGVHMYKGVGVRCADFISFFLNTVSHENEIIWSH